MNIIKMLTLSVDIYTKILIYLFSFFAVVLVFMVVAVITHHSIDKKRQATLALNESNVRICTYNKKTDSIRFFDKKNMEKQRLISSTQFYEQFNEIDRERVRKWISNFFEDSPNKSNFLTTSVKISSMKKECLSIYRVTSYDLNKQTLHFENTLLPGIDTRFNQRSSNLNFIKKEKEIVNLVKSKSKLQRKFSVIYIKMQSTLPEDMLSTTTREITPISMTSIYEPVDSLYKFLSKKRYLVFVNDFEAMIIDFDYDSKLKMSSLTRKIMDEMERFISIRSLTQSYSVAIGCSQKELDSNDSIETIIAQAKNMSLVAERKKTSKIAVYGVDSVAISHVVKNKSEELDSLIKNKTFKAYFTPVLSFDKSLDNYSLCSVIPFGGTFTSINEVYGQAKYNYRLLEFLQVEFGFVNNILEHYPNTMILLNYSLLDISNMVDALKSYPLLKNNIIIAFDRSEIENLFEADYKIENALDILDQHEIKYCLNLNGTSINIPKELLERFFLFVLSFKKVVGKEVDDNHLLTYYVSFLSILSIYKKDIIVNDVDDLSSIEIIHNIGYDNFVCKSIGGTSSSPYIPDAKWKKNMIEQDEKIE